MCPQEEAEEAEEEEREKEERRKEREARIAAGEDVESEEEEAGSGRWDVKVSRTEFLIAGLPVGWSSWL